jgi:hypothetical protein
MIVSKKPIIIQGIPFNSIKDAARHFGQHYGNAVRRINAGWTIEQALGLVERKREQPKRGKRIVTTQGTFRTVAEAAEHFGVSLTTLTARLASGWVPDEAVGIKPHTRPKKTTKPVMCQGKEYPNSWALAQGYGKPEKLVAKRLRLGWTAEQAVEVAERPPRFRDRYGNDRSRVWKEVESIGDTEYPATDLGEYKLYLITNQVNGKLYVGITISPLWQRFNGHKAAAKKGLKTKLYNAMRRYGVDKFTIQLLRNDAKSFSELQEQEIIEIASRGTIENGYNVSPGGSIGTPESIKVGEQVFPSRSAAAEYFGIDPSVFNLRLSRLGWTPEQAAEIERPEKYARHKLTVGGKTYPSLGRAAEAHGLAYQLVWSRLQDKGWTLEQALGVVPPPETVKYRGVPVLAFGVAYPSLDACAEANGVKPGSLWARVRKYGQTAEEGVLHLLRHQKD